MSEVHEWEIMRQNGKGMQLTVLGSTRMNQQLWIVYYLAINKLISEYYYFLDIRNFFPPLGILVLISRLG